MNNPRFEPKLTIIPEPPKRFGEDGGHFYRYYDGLADELDEDMVKSLKSQLDGILIFVRPASLFIHPAYLTRPIILGRSIRRCQCRLLGAYAP